MFNFPRKETLKSSNALIQIFRNEKVDISKIEQLEQLMLREPQLDIKPNYYFGKDLCVKEIFFKQGTIATGLIQKFEHVSILISGHMTLWTPFNGVHEVRGPSITEVKPGMKRAGYAHTDVHWLCAYGIRDVENYNQDEITEFLTFRYYGEYLDFKKNLLRN